MRKSAKSEGEKVVATLIERLEELSELIGEEEWTFEEDDVDKLDKFLETINVWLYGSEKGP